MIRKLIYEIDHLLCQLCLLLAVYILDSPIMPNGDFTQAPRCCLFWVKFDYQLQILTLLKRFMMEILMGLTLAVMGVYFFKSTDLPKDLKERSAMMQAEAGQNSTSKSLRMTLPKEVLKTPVLNKELDAKLAEMKIQKNVRELQLLNLQIDELTIEITTLEQEIKLNNKRNNEIQSIIDAHLINLQLLQEKISTLA